jgi:hypothetical protein
LKRVPEKRPFSIGERRDEVCGEMEKSGESKKLEKTKW